MASSIFIDPSASGTGPAPSNATFIVQTANASLPNAQAIGALSTGVLFGTTTTGVISSLGVGTVAQALIGGTTPAFGNAITNAGIVATRTDAWVLQNTTAATSGVTQQNSGQLRFSGTGWNSSGGGTSETASFGIYNLPATQAGTIIASLRFGYANSAVSAGAYTDLMTLNQAGNVTLLAAGTGFAVPSGGNFAVTSTGFLRGTGTTGQWKLENATVTTGVGLDVSVNSVLGLRTTAHSAYATLDCLGLKASGAAGFNGTVTPVTTITVTNGIVTNVA